MKKLLLLNILLFLSLLRLSAQSDTMKTFGRYSSTYLDILETRRFIHIDTTNHNNIWQIGKPDKKIFKGGFSSDLAIVTDTLNPYPVNNHSSFYIFYEHNFDLDLAFNRHLFYSFGFDFNYKINSDSLKDFGKIELSVDTGKTWIDILTDTNYMFVIHHNGDIIYDQNINFITGNSNDWEEVSININFWYDFFPKAKFMIFKFSFNSDSVQTNKDGFEISAINFSEFWEGINELNHSNIYSKIQPNPINESSYISFDNSKGEEFDLDIFNTLGEKIKYQSTYNNKIYLDRKDYSQGIYFYHLSANKSNLHSSGKFIVN